MQYTGSSRMPYIPPYHGSQQAMLDRAHVSLKIRQQPVHGLVALENKEKNRKPIDPPPIVQLTYNADHKQDWLVSPYLFMIATLIEIDGSGQEVRQVNGKQLLGQTSSSLHRLKDIQQEADGGFFIFSDISVRRTGNYKLRFNLFDQNKDTLEVVFVSAVESQSFKVLTNKEFPGLSESSHLSRSFSDQGVRLRLRKEQRQIGGTKRGYGSDEPSPIAHRPPSGTVMDSHYSMGGQDVKRTRHSIDYGHTSPALVNPAWSATHNNAMSLYRGNTMGGAYGHNLHAGQGYGFQPSHHALDHYGLQGNYGGSYGLPTNTYNDQISSMQRQYQNGPMSAPATTNYGFNNDRNASNSNSSYFASTQPPMVQYTSAPSIPTPLMTPPRSTATGGLPSQPFVPSNDIHGANFRTNEPQPELQFHSDHPTRYADTPFPAAASVTSTSQTHSSVAPTSMYQDLYPQHHESNHPSYNPMQSSSLSSQAVPGSSLMSSTLNSEYTSHYDQSQSDQSTHLSPEQYDQGQPSQSMQQQTQQNLQPGQADPYTGSSQPMPHFQL